MDLTSVTPLTVAALYARVSHKEQAENYSLPSQFRAMRAFAAAKDCQVFKRYCFVDIGHLGSTLDRPELTRLRRAVARGRVQIVICYEVDRFTRNAEHLALLKQEFESHGAKLEFVLGEQPHDVVFAEYEIAAISERISRALKEKAARGVLQPNNRPLYGYRWFRNKETDVVELVIDEVQAVVVRRIFDWAAEGRSLSEIATRLNRERVPTCTGVDWSRGVVGGILANPVYIGRFFHQRYQRSLDQMPSDAIEISVPAIIDPIQFELVHQQRLNNKKTKCGRPRKGVDRDRCTTNSSLRLAAM